MDFEKTFISWLNDSLSQTVPATVKAFSFNLYELADDPDEPLGIELIGAGMFDEDDPDWACDEVWEPKIRVISIPAEFSGDTWEPYLENMYISGYHKT